MKKPIKDVMHLKKGDKATIIFNGGDAEYTDTVHKVRESQTQHVSVIIQFTSGYTFPVLKTDQSWAGGEVWGLKEAYRIVPDVVPGTVGSATFGRDGTDVQRIHPILEGDPEDPFVWMIVQSGSLVRESEVLEFLPDDHKTTQYVPVAPW